MQELIQPTLRIIVRTVLFLAVVAWIVGQWWTVYGNVGSTVGMISAQAWTIGSSFPPSSRPTIGIGEARDDVVTRSAFKSGARFDLDVEFLGFGLYLVSGYSVLSIRHYLTVSTFTLINVALWWFYRKPKEVTPCES